MYRVWNIRMVQRFAAENYRFIWAHVSSRRELTDCSYFQHRLFFYLWTNDLIPKKTWTCASLFLSSFLLFFYKRGTLPQEKQPFSISTNHPGLLLSPISAPLLSCGCEEQAPNFELEWVCLLGLSSGKDRRGFSPCSCLQSGFPPKCRAGGFPSRWYINLSEVVIFLIPFWLVSG